MSQGQHFTLLGKLFSEKEAMEELRRYLQGGVPTITLEFQGGFGPHRVGITVLEEYVNANIQAVIGDACLWQAKKIETAKKIAGVA